MDLTVAGESMQPEGSGASTRRAHLHLARVRVERVAGPFRLAYLPAETKPVRFGTHGPIAVHYGIRGRSPNPMRRRSITLSPPQAGDCPELLRARWRRWDTGQQGKFTAEAEGDVETEDGVLVLRRIRVHYRLPVPRRSAMSSIGSIGFTKSTVRSTVPSTWRLTSRRPSSWRLPPRT